MPPPPTPETLKVRLDGALSNLTELTMTLLIAEGSDKMIFKGPFQPKLFYDSLDTQHIYSKENIRGLPLPVLAATCPSCAGSSRKGMRAGSGALLLQYSQHSVNQH